MFTTLITIKPVTEVVHDGHFIVTDVYPNSHHNMCRNKSTKNNMCTSGALFGAKICKTVEIIAWQSAQIFHTLLQNLPKYYIDLL